MKVKRQSKILELIRENDIETQEMLADLLNKAGFNVPKLLYQGIFVSLN